VSLRQITQAYESSGPIPLILRNPRRQSGGQGIRFQLVDLLSAATRCGDQARGTQAHQVLGDARCHQIRKFGGELTNGQGTSLGQQIENAPTRCIAQYPE
jgi:hypothetical protein